MFHIVGIKLNACSSLKNFQYKLESQKDLNGKNLETNRFYHLTLRKLNVIIEIDGDQHSGRSIHLSYNRKETIIK